MLSSVFSDQAGKCKNSHLVEIPKSFIIVLSNQKEQDMTDHEFFQLTQQQWFEDFVDAEVSQILEDMHIPEEILTCA